MQMHPETSRTISVESMKVLGTAVAAIVGLSLDTWVKIATLCAILLSGGYTAWKWRRDWRRAKQKEADHATEDPA